MYLYWKYNPIYASENDEKHGMAFGRFNHLYPSGPKHENKDILLNSHLDNIKDILPTYKNFELV